MKWSLEFEANDFEYRKQVWTTEKRPSAEEYRLRCQSTAGQAGGGGCDYGGLYDVFYIRDYHGKDPQLYPEGAVKLHIGTGKTLRGWVSKQWHGAPVLCILNASRAIGNLAVVKGIFMMMELIKMWSREPWTENGDESDDDRDQEGQDKSPR